MGKHADHNVHPGAYVPCPCPLELYYPIPRGWEQSYTHFGTTGSKAGYYKHGNFVDGKALDPGSPHNPDYSKAVEAIVLILMKRHVLAKLQALGPFGY